MVEGGHLLFIRPWTPHSHPEPERTSTISQSTLTEGWSFTAAEFQWRLIKLGFTFIALTKSTTSGRELIKLFLISHIHPSDSDAGGIPPSIKHGDELCARNLVMLVFFVE